MDTQKYILTMIVDNQPGVLSRVVGLFSGRGYNIESLTAAPTIDPGISRITIVTKANEVVLEQIKKQLRKLIQVIKLRNLSGENAIQRSMVLICVHAKGSIRESVLRIAETFRARVVDMGMEFITIEATGGSEKLEALIALLKPMGIKKISRGGPLALFREVHKED